MPLFAGAENIQLFTLSIVSIAVSAVSAICSIVNLLLIKYMKKWNGYLAILWYMGLCQLLYDLSFFPHVASNEGLFLNNLWNSLQEFGGVSVALWTNIMAYIILLVVVKRQYVDILINFRSLSAIAMIPATIFLIIGVGFYNNPDVLLIIDFIYYSLRLASILFNFIIFGIISYEANSMMAKTGSVGIKSETDVAICVLAQRMIYYPVMQAFCRIGASIYEPLYGFGTYPGNTSSQQFGLAMLYGILNPSAGTGYLVIFLLMQPGAYKLLRTWITCVEYQETIPAIENKPHRAVGNTLMSNTEINGRVVLSPDVLTNLAATQPNKNYFLDMMPWKKKADAFKKEVSTNPDISGKSTNGQNTEKDFSLEAETTIGTSNVGINEENDKFDGDSLEGSEYGGSTHSHISAMRFEARFQSNPMHSEDVGSASPLSSADSVFTSQWIKNRLWTKYEAMEDDQLIGMILKR